MLRIKRVGSYSIPRYPQEIFEPWKRAAVSALAAKGAVSAALLLLLESCDVGTDDSGGMGVTGPPPIPPKFLTENEARMIISDVFAQNGIALTPDVTFSVIGSDGDTTEVVLDGYNDSLRVGYEYVYEVDVNTFTPDLIAQLDADAAGSGPYVKATLEYERSRADDLEYLMQAFIDTLKAHGKI